MLKYSKVWSGALLAAASLPAIGINIQNAKAASSPEAGVTRSLDEEKVDLNEKLKKSEETLKEALSKGRAVLQKNLSLKAQKGELQDSIIPTQDSQLEYLDSAIANYIAAINIYETPPVIVEAKKKKGKVRVDSLPLPGEVETAIAEDLLASRDAAKRVLSDIIWNRKPAGADIIEAIRPPDPIDILPPSEQVAKEARGVETKIRGAARDKERQVRRLFGR